jgi:hypothetical protein
MNRYQVKGAVLRASDQGGRADPADETVINGAPYDLGNAMGGAAAGRAAYRAEYMRVLGRDVDEWLDGTESGQEI